jgi:NitT/TauT family transport system ATP-binding protein
MAGVSKHFESARTGRVDVLADITLTVEPGTFLTLVGPSGCGKTTLLRLADGLVLPDAGTVLVNGRPPRPGPEMGFVFQSYRLVPWISVRDNVTFALELAGIGSARRREVGDHYLRLVGLSDFAEAYPAALSGGMKQRVALARALATEPSILLMDEPFASLDAQTREILQFELLHLWAERRASVMFVTHSVDEAILLGDRVAVMSARPGTILEVVEVDLPRPRNEAVLSTPRFIEQRRYLWDRIRSEILADPSRHVPRAGIEA